MFLWFIMNSWWFCVSFCIRCLKFSVCMVRFGVMGCVFFLFMFIEVLSVCVMVVNSVCLLKLLRLVIWLELM